MGNFCSNTVTPAPAQYSQNRVRYIEIKDDLLFTIPELSPHLEYSQALSTPVRSPLHQFTPIVARSSY